MNTDKNSYQQLRFYKILSLCSVGLLIVSAVYIYNRQNTPYYLDSDGNKIKINQEMLSELFELNNVINISDPELIKKWELLNANIDSGKTGRKLNISEVRQKKDSFNTWNKKKFNLVKEISPYGFAFGKQRIRKMLYEIDSTNSVLNKLQKQDSLIFGVRAYLTFSNNQLGKKSRHIDLVFVPIMKNGHTFYNLNKKDKKSVLTGPDPMLLNTSSPCPKMCNE